MEGSQVRSSEVCSALGGICQKKPRDVLSMPRKASRFPQPLLRHKQPLEGALTQLRALGCLLGLKP